MAVIYRELDVNVLEMARQRVINAFSNNLPVTLSFSGGKDSIVLADVIYQLIIEGRVNAEQLEVIFVDEEAIFPDVERIVKNWRMKFMSVGAKFTWYCVESAHFNALNELSNDMSFVTWDELKKDVWVRDKPPFAIKSHPLARRTKSYQDFLEQLHPDAISLVGVRVAEGVQRRANVGRHTQRINRQIKQYPVYDWTDKDIWHHIKVRNLEIPETYMYLWQVGRTKNQMRLSQFFSIDTIAFLVDINQFYPALMEKISEREPNAYLASLYWDSEMFRRSTSTRRELEGKDEVPRDYKEMVFDLMHQYENDPSAGNEKHRLVRSVRRMLLRADGKIPDDSSQWKRLYGVLYAGDPKSRTMRAIGNDLILDYIKASRREEIE